MSVHGAAKPAGAGRLVVFALTGKPTLAWEVKTEGIGKDQMPFKTTTYVDAKTGKVVGKTEGVYFAQGRGYHSGDVQIETSRGNGGYVLGDSKGNQALDLQGAMPQYGGSGTPITDNDDSWGDNGGVQSQGVDGLYGAQVSQKYFTDVLKRNGLWGDGRGVKVRVNYGVRHDNAFWNGSVLTFGSGSSKPFTELDVIGHEFGHGITQNTANLAYGNYESGGLNEAYSDIWGTAIEFHSNNPADPGDYIMGEKLGTIRRMDRPSSDRRMPDCYSGRIGGLDPHFSAGPMLHAFYMMAEGTGAKTIGGVQHNTQSCDGSQLQGGIGHVKSEQIMFNAYRYLSSRAGYQEMRDAMVKSASQLFGASSHECHQAQKAMQAINVQGGGASCQGSDPGPGSNNDPAPQPTNAPQPTVGPAPTNGPMPNPGPGGDNNRAPQITNPGTQQATTGKPFSYQLKGTDPDGDRIVWIGLDVPAGLVVAPNGAISGTPTQAGTFTMTVEANDRKGGSTKASFKVVIGGSNNGPAPTGANSVKNGDFEQAAQGWVGNTDAISNNRRMPAKSGKYYLWLGGSGAVDVRFVQQQVKVPAGKAQLTYFTRITTGETQSGPFDRLQVQVVAGGKTSVVQALSNVDVSKDYQMRSVDLSKFAGQNVTLRFISSSDDDGPTEFQVDDVHVG